MPIWAGARWRDGDWDEAWIRVEDDRIVDWGEGRAPAAAQRAVLLQGVTNFHTHAGDAILRGQPIPTSLAEAVKPPTGVKHRALQRAAPSTVTQAIRDQLARYHAKGTFQVLDFREQGLEGIQMGREASRAQPVVLHLFGRSTRPQEAAEWARAARTGDGIGLSSATDVGPEAAHAASQAARAAAKPFAVHVSEGAREDMEAVLSLHPNLVVHACEAERADLRLLAEEGVPLVACPRSNEFFRLRPPPVALFEEMGGTWFLGTDNAMLGGDDVLDEARWLRARHPDLPDESLLRALTTRPQSVLRGLPAAPGSSQAPLLVLPLGPEGRVRWTADALVLDPPR